MDRCFVIQPFDGSTFDSRYQEIYKKAIESCDLDPYRVDEDPSSRVPIEAIEKNIRESRLCFADITTNNPNVWYELGYAFARGKDVVMVCCKDERAESKYPFDIQHRSIIEYRSKTLSDFSKLSDNIAGKLKSYLATSELTDRIKESPLISTEGLNSQEISFMMILLEDTISSDDRVDIRRVIDQMDKAGFTLAATKMAHRTLIKKGMIEIRTEENSDYHDTYDTLCVLTDQGENWLLENQDKILVRKKPIEPTSLDDGDDLPF